MNKEIWKRVGNWLLKRETGWMAMVRHLFVLIYIAGVFLGIAVTILMVAWFLGALQQWLIDMPGIR